MSHITIIISRIAEIPDVSPDHHDELMEIAERSPHKCSWMDALRVLLILWGYLR